MTNLFVRVLVIAGALLVGLSVSAVAVFVSIDCGSSESFVDENNIRWVGDDTYIKTGESLTVENPDSVSMREYRTLRVFTGKKNCYSIDVPKGERVLIRAKFHYGNYDGRSSPPIFDLQFDGNKWDTVEIEADERVYYERMYVTKLDQVSICVAMTKPGQLPFISAIEVRSLDFGMYGYLDPNDSYYSDWTNYGDSTHIRFPDDPFDRYWEGVGESLLPISVGSETRILDTGLLEKPPQSVLRTAAAPRKSSQIVLLNYTYSTELYINTYFTELPQLNSSQKRSFTVYMNNESISNPIIPPYQSALKIPFNISFNSSNTVLSLVPTRDSTLPPIINAMEIFKKDAELNDGTYYTDVKALALLQSACYKLQEWSGDPCLPESYNWDWVECSDDKTPRIVALYLGNLGLQGSLPDFSALDALQVIDLSNNNLSGEIPDFFRKFSHLKQFASGNPGLCGLEIPCSSPQGNNVTDSVQEMKSGEMLIIILGIIIPIFFVYD
ncbi:PREDICTED: probable LRR receptor-like serine/threonine-protein kinase At1g51860 [Nelumbo nucifera]|uniref:Probable LRR receptor-like serine/threonine-protein kinase At1g51860 n=1 Tax=Nelumbo nucifera TaxID=4432 RepID=A0A1U8BC45_NELNU|nr:PREDICTED: probable LRR receptor-like serine/threonine-protein kinase At1g51860 [Nelumbo nucifera]